MTAASRCPRGVEVGGGVGVGVAVDVAVGSGVGVFVGVEVGTGVGSRVAVGNGCRSRRSQATKSGKKIIKTQTTNCIIFHLLIPRYPF